MNARFTDVLLVVVLMLVMLFSGAHAHDEEPCLPGDSLPGGCEHVEPAAMQNVYLPFVAVHSDVH